MNNRNADVLEFGEKGDCAITRTGAAALAIGNGVEGDYSGSLLAGELITALLNATMVQGVTEFDVSNAYGAGAKLCSASEAMTLSLIGLTTDSAANLLPANSLILAAVAFVKATGDYTSFALGDASTPERFLAADTDKTAGSSAVGVAQWAAGTMTQAADAKARITCVGQPTKGQIRVVVFYLQFTAPTA